MKRAADKLAAALLHPSVRAQIPDAAAVRRRVRTSGERARAPALTPIVDPTPAPAFACAGCGAMRHSMRDARFHCKTWGRKRPRL